VTQATLQPGRLQLTAAEQDVLKRTLPAAPATKNSACSWAPRAASVSTVRAADLLHSSVEPGEQAV